MMLGSTPLALRELILWNRFSPAAFQRSFNAASTLPTTSVTRIVSRCNWLTHMGGPPTSHVVRSTCRSRAALELNDRIDRRIACPCALYPLRERRRQDFAPIPW